MSCPACGTTNPVGAKFCNQCGAPLSPTCPSCGAENPAGSKFCNACGARLDTAAPTPPVPAAIPSALVGARTERSVGAGMPASALAAGLMAGVAGQMRSGAIGPQGNLAYEGGRPLGRMGGERKQVTVLFADVSGFTSMSESLDPEDVHQIMNRAFEICVREVHRYEGAINQFTGDGIMALFGAPIAQPDAAQRAILAALAIQNALEDLAVAIEEERGVRFRMRIGINTGMAVVGAVGTDARADYTAVGDTTNLAARLEQIAEPGTIFISENTYKIVEKDFRCEALGPRTLKGKAQPVEVYRVLGLTGGHAHDGMHENGSLTSFAGREEELRALRRHIEKSLAGDGRVIGLVGDTGLGKSRLVHEVLDGLDRERIGIGEGHCLSYGSTIPYMPFLDMLRDLTPFAKGVCEARGEELYAAMQVEAAEIQSEGEFDLSQLLLRGGGGEDPSGSAADARHTAFQRLLDRLIELSTHAPLVLVIEDLQWIDKTSEELLGDLVRGIAGRPICVICTFTTDYRFPWADRSYYRHMVLESLSREAGVAMVRALLGGRQAPADLMRLVQDKAEGNPFYIEAVVRSLVDDGFLTLAEEAAEIAKPLSEIHLPDSLHEIVMARIDRLEEPLKETLQVAAVIGRQFEVDVLDRVLPMQNLQMVLDALVTTEMIMPIHGRSDASYSFRHAVTCEVAYQSLLHSRTRELHKRVGDALETAYADRLLEVAPRLARHFEEAEDSDRALRYLSMSAHEAQRLGAVPEGVEHIQRALNLLDTLPVTDARQRQRVDFLERLTDLRFYRGAMGDAAQSGAEALRLAEEIGYTEKLGPLHIALGGMSVFSKHWGGETALDQLLTGIRLCLETWNFEPLSRGYMHLGNAMRHLGRWQEAYDAYTRMVDISVSGTNLIGEVVGRTMRAHVSFDTGKIGEAIAAVEESLALARSEDVEWAVAFAASFGADFYLEADRLDEAEQLAAEGRAIGERMGLAFSLTNARLTEGRLAFARGDYPRAYACFSELRRHVETGPLSYAVQLRLAESCLQLGRVSHAQSLAEDALKRGPSVRDLPRGERLLAHVLLERTPPDLEQARVCLLNALGRFEGLQMPVQLAYTLSVSALLHDLSEEPERAAAERSEAEALFTECGAALPLRLLREGAYTRKSSPRPSVLY